MSMMVTAMGVPVVIPVPSGPALGVATVGFVLAEALVLYVGYGALTRVGSPVVRELLGRG